MRRLICALALLAVLSACRRRPEPPSASEGPANPSSVVRTADPQAEAQLLSGFHEVEQNAWRWAAHSFSVSLRAPALSLQRGATLRLVFAAPEVVIARGPVTIRAVAAGVELKPETYPTAGRFEYVRSIPASVFIDDPIQVDFTTDRFVPPNDIDKRELSVIVESIVLETIAD